MKRKRVWRYYCDHCGKGMCRKPDMAAHEEHCTKNPDRECALCAQDDDLEQRPMADLLAVLPDPSDATAYDDEYGVELLRETWVRKLNHALPALREATDGCPICMFAALRQHSKHSLAATISEFRLKDELAAYWAEINAVREESPY